MPSLNNRQFVQQEPLEGWNKSLPTDSMKGWRPARTQDPAPFDPGPDSKRGEIGVGQRILNVDEPGKPLEVGAGGLIPVDQFNDPAWDNSAWRYGGAKRMMAEDDPTGPTSEMGEEARRVTSAWESAPVETIGPDVQLRTNQTTPTGMPGRPAMEPQVNASQVEELRGSEIFEDPDGSERHPWVAEVEGKRYLLEGHHRATAARTRGTGEMQAHVIRGGNWGQIDEQMYDGPWRTRDDA